MSIESKRGDAAAGAASAVLPAGCSVDERTIAVPGGSLGLRAYRPARLEAAPRAGVVFFHGGGFVTGRPADHDALCGQLCVAAGCVVLASAYRLAPAHRFPTALNDAYFATSYIHEQADELGIDHRRLGVAGIEVGASLATGVARLAKERRNPELKFQILIGPWLDFRADAANLDLYADASVRSDPRCSPLLARNLIGLPPVWIVGGESDPHAEQAEAYAAHLREAHVAVDLCRLTGSSEDFAAMPQDSDAGRAALSECARAIDTATRT